MIPTWLIEYAEKFISENNYDSSHDMRHFINVYEYAKKIYETDYSNIELIQGFAKEDSLSILYYSAFCHDLIDAKYVNSMHAIEKLRKVFLENGYNENNLYIIIFLIDNMSFSKQRTGKHFIPSHLQLILDIVSDADKLDAYRVERVVAFQEKKLKDYFESDKEEKKRNWIKTILVKRVLMYKDHWLKTPYAKSIAPPLHDIVLRYVEENLSDSEMYDY